MNRHATSQFQGFQVAGQFQITAPGRLAIALHAHCAFPVHRTGRGAAVQFLVIKQGMDFEAFRQDPKTVAARWSANFNSSVKRPSGWVR